MSEAPAGTGMGPDEPVGSSRSNHRNRNMFILGGLALVLVAGVILAGVFPTGDRAGTTATDASPSPSTTATQEQSADPTTDASSTASESASSTATEEQSADATTDASTTDASPTPSASATVEVTTCADGGDCALGDVGLGGGLVFYIDSVSGLRYEMAPNGWGGSKWGDSGFEICRSGEFNYPSYLGRANGTVIGTGKQNTATMATADAAGKCDSPGAKRALAYGATDGSTGEWFIPSKDELNQMVLYSKSQGNSFTEGPYGFYQGYYWSSSIAGSYDAWIGYFGNGAVKVPQRPLNHNLPVRPIRMF